MAALVLRSQFLKNKETVKIVTFLGPYSISIAPGGESAPPLPIRSVQIHPKMLHDDSLDDRNAQICNDKIMLKYIGSLALLTYGLQSVYENKHIFYLVLSFCLISAFYQKSVLVSVVCASLILVHILAALTSLGPYWPAPVVISSFLGMLGLGVFQRRNWVHKSKPEIKWLIFATSLGLISIGMVQVWMVFTKVYPETIIFKIDPHLPIWMVGVIIFSFAVLNSFAEEFLFRGPLFEIDNLNLSVLNFAQSIAFGIYHFKGFSFGFSGAVLAFTFAMLQGYLRIKSQKFYYIWISHFVANIGMGILLYQISIAERT